MSDRSQAEMFAQMGYPREVAESREDSISGTRTVNFKRQEMSVNRDANKTIIDGERRRGIGRISEARENQGRRLTRSR